MISAALLFAVGKLVEGIEVDGAVPALAGAFVLGIANAVVRPVLVALTLPLTVLTLGLFLLVVNAATFGLAAAVVPGFRVRGCGAALVGSIVLALLNLAVSFVFGL